MPYYNTVNEEGQTVKTYEQSVKTQDEAVLDYLPGERFAHVHA